jgi:hypothetical protein
VDFESQPAKLGWSSEYPSKVGDILNTFILRIYNCTLWPKGNIVWVRIWRTLFLLFLYLFICIYIGWATLASPSPYYPLTSRQNLFFPLLQFCWRENIRDKKKDIAFLLVTDRDSYTKRFLALLPCICVLQPELVHLHLASASLRLLYLLAYSGHISHIQVLGFLPFPYSSCTHSALSVWSMSNNITAFVLVL